MSYYFKITTEKILWKNHKERGILTLKILVRLLERHDLAVALFAACQSKPSSSLRSHLGIFVLM
jgi:hypothetical protein